MFKPTRFQLTRAIDEKWTPRIQEYLNDLDAGIPRQAWDLSGDPELNPTRLIDILTIKLGYSEDDYTNGGYDLGFKVVLSKKDHASVVVYGTGMAFELFLQGKDKEHVKYQD